MKKILLLISFTIFLSSCLKKKEIQEMINEQATSKEKAEEIIRSSNFSTANLLILQEYFFSFAEKVHLLEVEQDAREGVTKMIKKSGVNKFYSDFFISKETWEKLNLFCDQGDYYACSYEMREYPKIASKLKSLLGNIFKDETSFSNEMF